MRGRAWCVVPGCVACWLRVCAAVCPRSCPAGHVHLLIVSCHMPTLSVPAAPNPICPTLTLTPTCPSATPCVQDKGSAAPGQAAPHHQPAGGRLPGSRKGGAQAAGGACSAQRSAAAGGPGDGGVTNGWAIVFTALYSSPVETQNVAGWLHPASPFSASSRPCKLWQHCQHSRWGPCTHHMQHFSPHPNK